jgi:hypothetical protein
MMMSFQNRKKKRIHSFFIDRPYLIRLRMRKKKEKTHAELRNSRIDNQLAQSYSHASDHLLDRSSIYGA